MAMAALLKGFTRPLVSYASGKMHMADARFPDWKMTSTNFCARQVKFQMKNNLYFEKGGPVPPAEVRTPPTAKPKGSALKKTSSVASRPKSPRMASVGMPKRKAKAALFF